MNELVKNIYEFSEKSKKYQNINYTTIDLTAKDINNSIGQTRVDVLYVCPLKKNSVESILKISRDKKICTYTGVPAYVVAGLVVGFDDEDGKPKILINLEEAKLQGADFSSKLLRISRIIN